MITYRNTSYLKNERYLSGLLTISGLGVGLLFIELGWHFISYLFTVCLSWYVEFTLGGAGGGLLDPLPGAPLLYELYEE